MTNQYSSSIQHGTGAKPDNSRRIERDNHGYSQSQSATDRTSFSSQLNENIINVYERAQDKIVVPDERTGADRRRSMNRRQSFPEAATVQAENKISDISLYTTNPKVNETYTKTGNTAPVVFTPSYPKGTLLDTWA